MGLSVADQIRSSLEFPFSPRGKDLNVRLQRIISQLKADLIVPFAGGAMRDGIGAFLACDLDLAFGNHRPRQRCAH